MDMRASASVALALLTPFLIAQSAQAQTAHSAQAQTAQAQAAPPPNTEGSSAAESASTSVAVSTDSTTPSAATLSDDAPEDAGVGSGQYTAGFDTGFETGLRFGLGTPVGKAGNSLAGTERDLKDLAPWRVPFWIDVGYRTSERTTFGLYGQFGFGDAGDACEGQCDWSDLRLGVQGQFRLTDADASLKPWIGVGLGYEWLSFRTLQSVQLTDETGELVDVPVRSAERLGGAELLLQLGLDFRVEDSLDVGPYLSATLAQYLTDSFNCEPSGLCSSRDSLEGSGFHSWLGIGLRGAYLP